MKRSRRSLSATKRMKVYDAAEGRCHICGQKIQTGERWDVDHVLPLGLGGQDDISNMRPAHRACHVDKTATDVRMMSKADRQRAKNHGHKKPRTIGYRKADGTIVWPDRRR